MQELKIGFEYAIKHGLSLKEMEMLISFMSKPQSTTNLAKDKGVNMNTVHATITRLKFKGLIVEAGQEGQHKIYKINI